MNRLKKNLLTNLIKLRYSCIIAILIFVISCNQGGLVEPQDNAEPKKNYTETEILINTNTGSAEDNYELQANSYSPISVRYTNQKLIVINFTPITLSNVNLKDSNDVVIQMFNIPAWTKVTFDEEVTATNVEIPENQNPIMAKFKKIKTRFSWIPHNYNPNNDSNANWESSVTGDQLRKYYVLSYNMAYFLSSDSFVQIMTTNQINDLAHYSSATAVAETILESTKKLRFWVARNVGGLGGGDVHGIANYVLERYSDPSQWDEIWTGVNVWFHEFAHCFGFSHNSNVASNWFKDQGYPAIQEVVDEVKFRAFIDSGDILFIPNFL